MATKPAPFLSYSANHEDVLLNRLFGNQTLGFFVDVGAAHPLFENDTRALYDRGWRGINIEPTPHFYRELVAQRPGDLNLNVAVSDTPGELPFDEIVGTGLSTATPDYTARALAQGFEVVSYTVPARTLREILQEAAAPAIDVLKVDVEGLELQVMRSNDWSIFRPRIILAEGTIPESPIRRQDGVLDYLAEQGYRHVYFDGLNDFYAERDFVIAADVFDRPLNVFDNFVSFTQHQLADANAALTAELESLRRQREQVETALTQQVDSLQSERANAAVYIESLTDELHRVALDTKTHATDLARAHTELIAMRDRGQALAQELEAASMSKLLTERDIQSLLAAQSGLQAQAIAVSQRLDEVYASSSWRVTRPLRALARPQRTLRFVLAKFASGRLHLL